jgi:microcystin-dependent protein
MPQVFGHDFVPTGAGSLLARSSTGSAYTTTLNPLTRMALQSLPPAGGSLPHNNMQPYLTLNFCIALQGIFPQRP